LDFPGSAPFSITATQPIVKALNVSLIILRIGFIVPLLLLRLCELLLNTWAVVRPVYPFCSIVDVAEGA
jgi:hypothetical protein